MKQVIIEENRIAANIDAIQHKIGGAAIIAVVKGGGYGLLISEIVPVLLKKGISHFAVSEPHEAIKLRAITEDAFVLLLPPVCGRIEIKSMLERNITLSVSNTDELDAVNAAAKELNTPASVHLKIDTGFGRFGALYEDCADLAKQVLRCEHVRVTGIYSHLSNATMPNDRFTKGQIELFLKCIERIEREEVLVGMRHILNSAGILNYPEAALDAVRAGSLILGRSQAKGAAGLSKVGTLLADVQSVRTLPKGFYVGYSKTFRLKKETKLAVINVGYMDGAFVTKVRDSFRFSDMLRYIFEIVKLAFRHTMTVKINGKSAKIAGKIGMCNTICDVTGINVTAGDKAALEINPILVDKNIPRKIISE